MEKTLGSADQEGGGKRKKHGMVISKQRIVWQGMLRQGMLGQCRVRQGLLWQGIFCQGIFEDT